MRRLLALSLLALPLLARPAAAAPIAAVFDVEASGFADLYGTGATPPADPASLVVLLSFDPATGDQFDSTAGLTVLRSTLALSGPLAFDYDSANDVLTFGGAGLGGIGITAGTNDLLAQVGGAYRGTPAFEGLAYTTAATSTVFESLTGTTTVPEPASATLVLTGVALLAARRRRRA